MTKTVSAIATIAATFMGRMVEVSTNAASGLFKIASLSDKIGSLKDGTKGEYVILQSADDAAVVISLHPQKAKSLLTKGEFEGMKLVDEAEADASEAAADAGADAPEEKAPSKKALFMAVYNAGVAAGKARKDIKADCADLGLSDAGFNTYYQNAKSGKWA